MKTCSFTALFPSPIIFGSMMDSSCLLWSTQGCSSYGACLIHDNADLAFRVSGTISGMKVLVLLIEVYVSKYFITLCKDSNDKLSKL